MAHRRRWHGFATAVLAVILAGIPSRAAAVDCPTAVRFEPGTGVTLDAGFSGFTHDEPIFGTALDLALSCGPSTPPCGTCTILGVVANPAGIRLRCGNDTSIACSVATEVSDCGAVGRCRHYVSPPQSLAVGGFATCHTTELAGPIGGSVNVETGAFAATVPLEASLQEGVIPVPDDGGPIQGCARCNGDPTPNDEVRGGTCDTGPRAGLACDVHGTSPFSDFGSTSFDCPPDPSEPIVHLHLGTLPFSTTPQTFTLTAASPRCTGGSVPGGTPCFCATCNNAESDPCSADADCPPSGGNPGVCNGRRCVGGSNDGSPCAQASACPGGGFCTRPGEPTRPNACVDDTTTPSMEGCIASGGNDDGFCEFGPIEAYCSNHTNRGCLDDDDCDGVSGSCTVVTRRCWADNGVTGATISVDATATAPVGGIADPTDLGALACMRPTADAFTDIVWGLPGLARMHQPGRLVFGSGSSAPTPTTTPPAPTPTPTPALCPPMPAACATPIAAGRAMLQLKDLEPDDKDRLVWKWTKGAAVDPSDLGDPVTSDDYALCLYDASGRRATLHVPAGGTCRGKPCWQARSTGFVYRNKDAAPDGITQLTLKTGAAGKAQLQAKGQGAAVPMPALGSLASPLQVQLRNLGNGACWGAVYSAPFERATEVQLKDRSD
jgi:hypothetical protein